jgi:hypothetical protein
MKELPANDFRLVKLKLITFIGIVGFVVAVFYHYILGMYLKLPWPSNSFLFTPKDRFMDFYHTWIFGRDILAGSSPYLNAFPCVYFPFVPFAILPFSFGSVYIGFMIFILLFIAVFGWFLYQNIKGFENCALLEKAGYVILLTITSYPLLFVLDRGNIEGLLFIFLALFIYFYKKEKFLLSIIALALAISMKLYPAVLLILLISDKRYKEAIWCFLITVGVTVSSLFLMKGGIFFNLAEFMKDLKYFQGRYLYLIGNQGTDYGHSLFNVFKGIDLYLPIIKDVNAFISLYSILAFAVFVLLALYIIFIEKKLWKKTTLLVFSMMLLPQMSYDYTLIDIYIPLMLFITSDEKISRSNLIISVLFALLIIPKNYMLLVMSYDLHLSVYLTPLIMLFIMGIILKEGLLRSKVNKGVIL